MDGYQEALMHLMPYLGPCRVRKRPHKHLGKSDRGLGEVDFQKTQRHAPTPTRRFLDPILARLLGIEEPFLPADAFVPPHAERHSPYVH